MGLAPSDGDLFRFFDGASGRVHVNVVVACAMHFRKGNKSCHFNAYFLFILSFCVIDMQMYCYFVIIDGDLSLMFVIILVCVICVSNMVLFVIIYHVTCRFML